MLITDSSHYQLHCLPVGPLQANCYLLADISSHNCLIIDPGAEGDIISEEIFSLNLQPFLIFLTHGHTDHVGGVLPLFLNFQTPIYLDKKDFFLYSRAQQTATHFTHLPADPVVPPELILSASSCQQLLKNIATPVKILHIPGHTPGLCALYFPALKWLFSGDLLFADGSLGRTDFAYSRPRQMSASLAKVKKLPTGTTIFPGHGNYFHL